MKHYTHTRAFLVSDSAHCSSHKGTDSGAKHGWSDSFTDTFDAREVPTVEPELVSNLGRCDRFRLDLVFDKRAGP